MPSALDVTWTVREQGTHRNSHVQIIHHVIYSLLRPCVHETDCAARLSVTCFKSVTPPLVCGRDVQLQKRTFSSLTRLRNVFWTAGTSFA